MGNSKIREKALKAKVRREPLEIPEWDTTIEIRGMTLGQQADFFSSLPDEGSPNRTKKIMIQTIIQTVFDPADGQQVFEQADAEFLLTEGDSVVFRRIMEVSNRLMGLSSQEELEEDLGKEETDA